MIKTATTAAGEGRELLAFCIGTQDFCIDIMAVREIRGWTPETTIPEAPDFVRGMIDLRGHVLPVVDLASRLGLEITEPTARNVIVVAEVDDRQVGLLVGSVSGIITITDDMVQATPDVASGAAPTFVRGVLLIDGHMVSLLSLDRVLPEHELEEAA